MILYVNGSEHTAAAEAVNPYVFAHDDASLGYMKRLPHPANLAVSWGKILAGALRAGFHCGAESLASNDRIMRTTREWLSKNNTGNQNILVVIQWAPWDREEWPADNVYYQIGQSTKDIPPELEEKYNTYIANLNIGEKINQSHADIFNFHQELNNQDVAHIFFNGSDDFSSVSSRVDWGASYIDPYNPHQTFESVVRAQSIDTVSPKSPHFGTEAHSFWHKYLLNYILTNKII